MSKLLVRKKRLIIDNVYSEGGPRREDPIVNGAIAAIVKNPFAGQYVEDLSPLTEGAKELAAEIAPELLHTLGGAEKIQAYGKGAIVGVLGELEHGALWHEAGGWAMRAILPKAKSIVPAAKLVASAGTTIAVPMHHIEAAYVRSHFNVMDLSIVDAPRPDELVYVLVMSTGGRVHERLGGLRVDQISVGDGQR